MTDRWKALWVLSAARVAMGFQFQVVGSTAPLLRGEFGVGLAEIGWLVGIYLLPGVVLALPGGMLSARFGDRRIAIAGMALMVAGGVVSALAEDMTMLEAGRLIGGMGGVLFNVTASKMIADWFVGREIELAMSIFVSTWPIGIGIGLLTLGGVAAAASVPVAFGLTAVFAAVSLLLIAALYRSAPDAAAVAPPRLSVLSRREWLLLCVASAGWSLYNVAFALLVAFLPTLLSLRGLNVSDAGAITAVLSVTLIVSIQASGWLIARIGHATRVAVLGLLAWAALLPALLHGEATLLWVTLAGLAGGTAAGVLVAAPARFLSPASRPVGLGVFYTLFYVGMALGPRAVGAWADRAGAPDLVVWAAAGLSLLTAGLVLVTAALTRPRREPAPAATPGT
jgi:MFS family permease